MPCDDREVFSKPPITIKEQIELLKNRGLIIESEEELARFLANVGYYRFSGYSWHFECVQSKPRNHKLKEGTTFEAIKGIYIFDRKLRLHVMDAIERIEIAIRTAISNHLCLKGGPHWFLDRNFFHKNFDHTEFVTRVKEETGHPDCGGHLPRSDDFLRHYYAKYKDPSLPPSWMIVEVLSFGRWSKAYRELRDRSDAKAISDAFRLPQPVFNSWIHSIAHLRNLCAHHCRVWNRKYQIYPKKHTGYPGLFDNERSFSSFAAIIQHFLLQIAPDSSWADRLKTLMQESCIVPYTMGFKSKWHEHLHWKNPINPS